MFVCVCHAVSDRQIKDAVAAGARNLHDLQAALGVATCCGCCAELAVSYLNQRTDQQAVPATASGKL